MGKKKNKIKKTDNKKKKNTGGQHFTYASKNGCHTGQEPIFTTSDGVTIFAGGKNRQGGWHIMNPYPDLAIGPSETLGGKYSGGTTVPDGFTCDAHIEKPPLFISLDWPDFSVPFVPKEFWYALVDDIRSHGFKRVSTQCAGGHGRTGVQLAILAYIMMPEHRSLWPTSYHLIEWVRDKHCVHAVEAKSQQQYIAEVCGIPEGESAIHSYKTNYTWDNWKKGDDKGKVQTISAPTIGMNDGTVFGTIEEDDIIDNESGLALLMGDDVVANAYCPVCDYTLVAEKGSRCFDCGESLEFPNEPNSECPVCETEYLVEGEECHMCYTDPSHFEQDDSFLSPCSECGMPTPSTEFTAHGDTCNMCVAIEMGMKVRRKDATIKCDCCNRYKPAHQFFVWGVDDKDCMPCQIKRIASIDDMPLEDED